MIIAFLAAAAAVASTPAPPGETAVHFKLKSGVEVTLIEAPFSAEEHNIESCGPEVCLIDGEVPLGNAGSIPTTYLKTVRIVYKDRSADLPVENLYNPQLKTMAPSGEGAARFDGFCYDEAFICGFRAALGPDGEVYAVEWKISHGRPQRTVASSSSDIWHFFQKNISPPQYQ